MQGGFWRRHGWKVLLFLTTVIGLFGLGDILFGMDAERLPVTGFRWRRSPPPASLLPGISMSWSKSVVGGIHLIVASLLGGAMLLVPFRRGERCAWYTMWTFPAWSVAAVVSWLFVERQPGAPPPPPAISGSVFFGLFAALLWVSRATAFHGAQDVATTEGA